MKIHFTQAQAIGLILIGIAVASVIVIVFGHASKY